MVLGGLIFGLIFGLIAGALLERDAWLLAGLIGAVLGGLTHRVGRLNSELVALRAALASAARPGTDGGQRPVVRPDVLSAAALDDLAPRSANLQDARGIPKTAERAPVSVHVSVPVSVPVPVSVRVPAPAPALGPTAAHAPSADAPIGPFAAPAGDARDVHSDSGAPVASSTAESTLGRMLFGSNAVVRLGILVLFFGVAFLLKYAYERTHVPPELRLVAVSGAGLGLLALGWKLRARTPGYGFSLQGGGIGLLFLTIFSAQRLYAVLPPGPSFALMLAVAVGASGLAVAQDSLALAVLGVSGGFLAPILASSGHGSHTALFAYYVILNLAILGVALNKAWRPLNAIGFAFTFVIGLYWGARDYRPEFFRSTEPFLLVFFLIYVLIPVLFARHRRHSVPPALDTTLTFGVPLVAFGLQAALVRDVARGAAWSALALGAFYLAFGVLLWRKRRPEYRFLTESFLALGAGFATLAILLAFDGRTTSALWAIEGMAVVWAGTRQDRHRVRGVGYLLELGAGLAFAFYSDGQAIHAGVLDSWFVGCLLIGASGWFCSAYVARHADRVLPYEHAVSVLLLAWGGLWWTTGGIWDIEWNLESSQTTHATLLFLALSSGALSLFSRLLSWPIARFAGYCLAPIMIGCLLSDDVLLAHPLADGGWLAWPVAFAIYWQILHRHEAERDSIQRFLHPLSLWMMCLIASWEASWQAQALFATTPAWRLSCMGLAPAACLWLVQAPFMGRRWPISTNSQSYLLVGAVPIMMVLLLWIPVVTIACDADPSPLPYLPVLNPLDLSIALVCLTLVHAFLHLRRTSFGQHYLQDSLGGVYALAGSAVFIWVTAILLHTLHLWASVPYDLDDLWHSALVQGSISVYWMLIALGLMVSGAARALRPLWIAGAILMGVVVAKLFAVDLSHVGSVERIVSFIGAGGLMLVIGYFAPAPPRAGSPAHPSPREP